MFTMMLFAMVMGAGVYVVASKAKNNPEATVGIGKFLWGFFAKK
ncbi:MAG: hypothetical protein ACRC8S_15055 [Fimbriiglobus sp.]